MSQGVRAGLGYRLHYGLRFGVLLQYDESRDTLDEEFDVESYVLDLRVNKFF